jgi:hypothetical protein
MKERIHVDILEIPVEMMGYSATAPRIAMREQTDVPIQEILAAMMASIAMEPNPVMRERTYVLTPAIPASDRKIQFHAPRIDVTKAPVVSTIRPPARPSILP